MVLVSDQYVHARHLVSGFGQACGVQSYLAGLQNT